jgi:hypothetical protein
MRKFFPSGRRRYALVFVVIAGSLALVGAQCQPTKEPVKPPAPTGLSIAPTSHDFGDAGPGEATPQEFVVTNNGPDTSGTLFVGLANGSPTSFKTSNDTCTGNQIDAGDSCTVDAVFDPKSTGQVTTDLIAESSAPADGTAVAVLTGNGTL